MFPIGKYLLLGQSLVVSATHHDLIVVRLVRDLVQGCLDVRQFVWCNAPHLSCH